MALNFKLKVPKYLKSVRYSLAGINSVFLLIGILLLIVGVTIFVVNSEYDELITQRFSSIPAFVIATAALILLGSVLGFYAALSESFYFIAGYVLVMLMVLIFEMSIVIAAFRMKDEAPSDIRSTMLQSLQFYSTRIEIAKLWDDLQMSFECCGVAGRFDYISNQIPVSCCLIDYGTISPFECGTANAHPTGCASALGEWLSYNAHVIGVTALVALCIQVLLTALGGWLAWRSKFEEVELES